MADSTVQFECKNGERVTIHFSESNYTIFVKSASGKEVGGLRFRLEEMLREEVLHLTWAYLDHAGTGYLRQGIGEECLRIASEETGLRITAAQDDGLRKDDGSHLTGDAPRWIQQMVKKGRICQ